MGGNGITQVKSNGGYGIGVGKSSFRSNPPNVYEDYLVGQSKKQSEAAAAAAATAG